MKITANATAYGIPIEINVVEHRTKVWATVHRPDGSTYRAHTRRTEEPGRYFHPLRLGLCRCTLTNANPTWHARSTRMPMPIKM
jgi:hypothetical protein